MLAPATMRRLLPFSPAPSSWEPSSRPATVQRAAGAPAAAASEARALEADAAAPLRPARLAQVAEAPWHGGPTTTSTGETVDVRVSDALPADASSPQQWAELLTGLLHGPELSQLTLYVETLPEVQQVCGSNALGCYAANEMVVPGEAAGDVGSAEIIRHEYGHHIAYHRANPPWDATDWGPKRWASAENVCARVSRQEAYPGDEGSNYTRNPGEAWAETYRLVDERPGGDHDRDLADRLAELLPVGLGAPGGRAGRGPAVDLGAFDVRGARLRQASERLVDAPGDAARRHGSS